MNSHKLRDTAMNLRKLRVTHTHTHTSRRQHNPRRIAMHTMHTTTAISACRYVTSCVIISCVICRSVSLSLCVIILCVASLCVMSICVICFVCCVAMLRFVLGVQNPTSSEEASPSAIGAFAAARAVVLEWAIPRGHFLIKSPTMVG